MKELTKADIEVLYEIIAYKKVEKQQVNVMQNFITKFIDAKAHICAHCSSQIRFAHKRITIWASKNKAMIDEVLNADDKHRCIVCGVEMTDKRKKYCSQECKKKANEK